jgi:cell division protein FtsW
VVQSLVALGSGHITGTGIGGAAATWGLLPNAQTDFIFSVVGNELGLVGAVAVVAAFAAYGWLGVRIAVRATDGFASLLAAAITCWVVCQAFINIGGVVGVLPETGIPLPFLSFGGSSLVVVLGATGLLINVARHPAGTRSTRRRRSGPAPARPSRP